MCDEVESTDADKRDLELRFKALQKAMDVEVYNRPNNAPTPSVTRVINIAREFYEYLKGDTK